MADDAKTSYGAATAVLVVLGLVAVVVFVYARCGLFVSSPSPSLYRVEDQKVDQDIAQECERRFAQRKSHALGLYERGLLDAQGLSDIGALGGYGISTQAAGAVLDILEDVTEVDGVYGLQNDYNGVADAVCAVVAQDEMLIREGAREAFVNR